MGSSNNPEALRAMETTPVYNKFAKSFARRLRFTDLQRMAPMSPTVPRHQYDIKKIAPQMEGKYYKFQNLGGQ